MIPEAEIRRLAANWQADPMILDLDYSLSWFLAALSATPGASRKLGFKGGTCLRKCYFAGYRFSEDLDFPANSYITPDDLTGWVEQAAGWSTNRGGPDFLAQPYRFETSRMSMERKPIKSACIIAVPFVGVAHREPSVWT